MNSNHERLEHLFWRASQIDSASERRLFLEEACGEDQSLLEEVEALLASMTSADEFAQTYQPTTAVNRPDIVGERIGPYAIREKIGEGGFGVVYVAEQERPLRRKVAIKLIKPGMDSSQIVARFEAERQALALMDHPNIAKVLDAGTTEDGRPYFVMELVNGIPITAHANQQQLPIPDRLRLMKSVCEAVEHAHKKGIIHRDLKPSNVLVTLHDGQPVAKVIDFGVAKALHQRLTEHTIYTAMGQMVGTPMYMSPEQAEMSGLDVDTRSDVYSLGVLLYELLTGMTPFDVESFKRAGLEAMLMMIRECEPPRPSLRVSTAATQRDRSRVDDHRQVDARRLSASLKGELDWIVMKSLEKQRQRRYQSARDLAADLNNFLTNQPVEAGPPSRVYRARKYIRRNRVAIGLLACAIVVALSIVGSLTWVTGERIASRNRERIRVAQVVTDLEQRQTAIKSLVDEQKWADALSTTQALLSQPDVSLITTEDHDDMKNLSHELQLVLELEAAEMHATNWTDAGFDYQSADWSYQHAFRRFGVTVDDASFVQAAEQLRSRISLVNPIVTALDGWALANRQISDEMESYYLRTSRARRPGELDRPGSSPFDSEFATKLLQLSCSLDDNPLRNRIRKLAIQPASSQRSAELVGLAQDPASPRLPVSTIRLLASTLRWDRQKIPAVELLHRAHLHRPDEFWINYALAGLLTRERNSKDLDQLRFTTAALVARPDNSNLLNSVGAQLRMLGRGKESEGFYRRAIDIDPGNLFARTNLATLLMDMRKLEEAKLILEETLRSAPDYAPAYVYLSAILMHQHRPDESAEARRMAMSIHPDPTFIVQCLIAGYGSNRLFPENVQLVQEAIDNKIELFGDDLYRFGSMWIEKNNHEEAISLFEQALQKEFYEEIGRADTYVALGKALRHEGREREAYEAFHAGLKLTSEWAPLHDQMARLLAETRITGLRNPSLAVEHARRGIELYERDSAEDFYRYAWQSFEIALTADDQHLESIDAFRKYLELSGEKQSVVRAKVTERALQVARDIRTKGDAAQATELCRAAVAASPDSADAHVTLGMTLRYWSGDGESKDDEAIEHFRRAIIADPGFPAAHGQLSRLLSNSAQPNLREPDKALEHARIRMTVNPDPQPDAYALATLGMAQYRLGQWMEAIDSLTKARDAPGNARAPLELFLAMAHWQLGEHDEARQWYDLGRRQKIDMIVFQHVVEEASAMIGPISAGDSGQRHELPEVVSTSEQVDDSGKP